MHNYYSSLYGKYSENNGGMKGVESLLPFSQKVRHFWEKELGGAIVPHYSPEEPGCIFFTGQFIWHNRVPVKGSTWIPRYSIAVMFMGCRGCLYLCPRDAERRQPLGRLHAWSLQNCLEERLHATFQGRSHPGSTYFLSWGSKPRSRKNNLSNFESL